MDIWLEKTARLVHAKILPHWQFLNGHVNVERRVACHGESRQF